MVYSPTADTLCRGLQTLNAERRGHVFGPRPANFVFRSAHKAKSEHKAKNATSAACASFPSTCTFAQSRAQSVKSDVQSHASVQERPQASTSVHKLARSLQREVHIRAQSREVAHKAYNATCTGACERSQACTSVHKRAQECTSARTACSATSTVVRSRAKILKEDGHICPNVHKRAQVGTSVHKR
jgi:hypothetical protein